MRKFFNFLYPTLILAAICLIVSLALSSANMITKDRIAVIEEQNTNAAMKRVMEADKYDPKTVEDEDGNEVTYYEAVKDNAVIGFIFTTSANGYGGEVKVMTAILDGNPRTVKAVEILDVSNETPGLGQNAKSKDFTEQFDGLISNITVTKNEANSENNEIKALTGATFTSKAVTAAVNKALALCEKIKS